MVSKEEVAKHCTRGDCWVIINGKVYDVSHFHSLHPGEGINGQYIADHAGKDCSDLFEKFHQSDDPFEMLEKSEDGKEPGIVYIGELDE
ncbi:hypothetical protein DFA_11779 [Cavenderia fasciculata]|uniref:Cytochrome b5 heme-binding domain-containing protein n=1 Tax=Cavenderia fasciculata TaxID=261658 RepID=F4QE70_CACFS|nr:uncharacterized protein DFA_11779 [Cavenderia fasciculata]EGG14017.1 hypothetical protein DFA_11779 [Cavenderia fasciculata]|eukprot:XP_004350725.1 hypothetical protein DFA_11779 [Cavenderia fasciculata]